MLLFHSSYVFEAIHTGKHVTSTAHFHHTQIVQHPTFHGLQSLDAFVFHQVDIEHERQPRGRIAICALATLHQLTVRQLFVCKYIATRETPHR
jgi:hypothetical protein